MFKAFGKHSGVEYFLIPKWIEIIINIQDKNEQRREMERMVNMIEQAVDLKKQ